MSSLVTDFLINPVLRQARRFSNTIINERIDPITNNRTLRDQSPLRHGGQVSEVADPGAATSTQDPISDRPLVTSPLEDDSGLEARLEAFELSFNAPRDIDLPSTMRRRLDSNRSDGMSMDDSSSGNPAVGIPSLFRTASPMTASYSSTNNNRAVSSSITSRGSTENSAQIVARGSGRCQQDGTLPENDGMGTLRRNILDIQERNVSSGEKAQLMHQLLTEGYNHSQLSLHAKSHPRAPSPTVMVSQDRPITPGSLGSFSFWQKNTNDTPPSSSPTTSHTTFQLSESDLKPTYAPTQHRPAGSDSDERDNTESGPQLGCQHYKRNVKLQCFDCGGWYTCRFCHDEVENHKLNRKETRNMLCMLCRSAQRASEICVECGVRAAWYYCGICKLWDDDMNKSIYHCADCGICRVGHGLGKDFVHCKTCGVCVAIANENSHKCIERASDSDCPICGEYMFTSQLSVVFMKCGHGIHRDCHHELMKTMYKCPICSQSVVNMETQFRNLDRAIESQPMPPQFQDTKAIVSCNDCYAKSLVKYHWLGLKCAICDSYNTAQLQILSDPNVEIPTALNQGGPMQPETIADDDLFLDHRSRFLSESSLDRSRRHSSHGPAEPGSYAAPTRIARSVSPFRGSPLANERTTDIGPVVESDDEDIEFWGGDAPRSPMLGGNDMEEEEDSDMDSAMSVEEEEEDDDDDDDGDEEDRMDLIGHR